MLHKILVLILLLTSTVFTQKTQRTSIETETRAIRRDVPMTNSILNAFKEGTRDFSGKPGKNYWQLRTDYTIEATMNPADQKIYGKETITLHNNSNDELTSLVLKLDHNIFRAFVPRGSSVPAETTEGMVVTKIVVNGDDVDLSLIPRPRRRGQQLETRLEAFGLDQTVARITLAKAIKAKSKVDVYIEWSTKLPGGSNGRAHRMTQRWDNTLFQPTQWFPRIAKYDDLRGWKTTPYLGPAEFFNNFGRFDVKITAPGGWLVSATGILQNPKDVLTSNARKQLSMVLDSDDEITIVGDNDRGPGKSTQVGNTLQWHYIADNVNDFVWATSNDYTWKATRATIPGVGPIPIYMFYLPERANRFKEAGVRTRHALEFYSKLWAPYPFPQLTLQDGPSAGMEYPMVINSNQGAADHETAHQWWPMMLGTNESRYGWMDEGFNSYMNILSRADTKGVEANLNGLGQRYGRESGKEDEAPMMWISNYGGDGYRFQTYRKAPLMLSMLGGIVGDDNVQKAMSEYTKAWKFKHPSPWDYIFFMNNALGEDLEWFWYYWLWTTESVDGSIKNVMTSGNSTKVMINQAGQMPSPIVLKVEFESANVDISMMKNAKKLDDKTVLVTWPVDIWFDGMKSHEVELKFGNVKIKEITLDPYGRFPDKNTKDNVWTKK